MGDLQNGCCEWIFDHHCPPLQISALFTPGKIDFYVFFHSVTEKCYSAPHYSRTVESIMEKVCSCNLTLHTIFTLNIVWIFDVLSDNISLESAVFLNSMRGSHHPPLTMQGGWWWNRCSFHALGWSGYVAPIGIPISDALGLWYCAPLPSADSDGFDSFLEWPLVLAPIQPGDRGKPGLARHVSSRETQQSGSKRGGGKSAATVGPHRHLTSFLI